MRAAAVAAVLLMMVTVTPIGGYVVNAAEEFYSWVQHIGTRQTKKGLTVELIETGAAGDFLYLTVNESYSRDYISKDSETYEYTLPDIHYEGVLKDGRGHSLKFDSNQFLTLAYVNNDYADYYLHYKDRVFTDMDDDWYKTNRDFTVNAQYKVYIPDLTDFITDAKGNYTCKLTVSSEKIGSKMKLKKFRLKNLDNVLNAKIYPLDRTVGRLGYAYYLNELQISSAGVNVIMEVAPSAYTSDYDEIYYPEPSLSLRRTDDEYSSIGLAYQWGSSYYVTIDGKYYAILSNIEYDYGEGTWEQLKDRYMNTDLTLGINGYDDGYLLADHYYPIDEKYYPMDDITLKGKKIDDNKYELNQTLTIDHLQIHLDSIEIDPEHSDDMTLNSRLEYPGKDEISQWNGNIYFMNAETKEMAILYLDYNVEDQGTDWFVGVNQPHSNFEWDYRDDVEGDVAFCRDFLENPSQWHVFAIQSDGLEWLEDDSSVEIYGTWINTKLCDLPIDELYKLQSIHITAE